MMNQEDCNRNCNALPDSTPAPAVDVDEGREPFPENGSGVRCVRCGAESPAGNQCAACGAFITGNGAAKSHGLYSYRATGALPADLRVSVDEFRDALVSAQGGLEELDQVPVRAGLCRLLVDCEVGKRLLMNEIIKRGIDTKPGRAAYDRFLQTLDRWQRIASTIGLERKARAVRSFADAIRAAGDQP